MPIYVSKDYSQAKLASRLCNRGVRMKIQSENVNLKPEKIKFTEQKTTIVAETIEKVSHQAESIKEMLKDALAASGFSTSKENIKLAMMLMRENMPVNKETLTMIKQAMSLIGAGNESKALLLVLNSIEPSEANLSKLNSYISGDVSLMENIKNVANLISEINDPTVRDQLAKIVLNDPILGEARVVVNVKSPTETIAQQAAQTLTSELSASIEQIITGIKNANTEIIAQNIDRAAEQTISELTDDLTATPEAKEVVKQILQEVLSEATSKIAEGKTLEDIQVRQLVEAEISKTIPQGENNAVIMQKANQLTAEKAAVNTALAKALSFDPTNTASKDLNSYLNELKHKLGLLVQTLTEAPQNEMTQHLVKEVETLQDNLNFLTQMKNDMFLQLPLHINEHFTNAELYIMKNKKSMSKGSRSSHSALLAIDTAFLGRFEAYVQKEAAAINVQFRTETEFVEELVKKNIEKLTIALSEHGYRLDSLMYKQLTEAFTIENIVKASDTPLNLDNQTSFDIRR